MFGLGNLLGLGATVFDPATLSLTGWWRADYSNSPWNGTASRGGSGNQALTEATNPPVTGDPVSTRVPASFNGTNSKLANLSLMSTFITTTAYSVVVLVNVTALSGGSSPDIVGDTAGFFGLNTETAGGNKAKLLHFDTVSKNASVPFQVGSWQLIQARYTGTVIEIRVNGDAWNTTAANALGALTGSLKVGTGYASPPWLNGKILELMLASTAFTDETFNRIRDYCGNRYGLNL